MSAICRATRTRIEPVSMQPFLFIALPLRYLAKFAYNFGDYWRSEVANSITELDEGQVTYSQYHRMDKVVISKYDDDDSDEDDDNVNDDIKTVVILR